MTINVNKIKMMTNYGLAGEDINEGLIKTVYFARNGVFEQKKGSWMGTSLIKASDYVLNASTSIEELKEEFELKEMEHKLPLHGFAAAYHFYKHIVNLNGSEAQINFYINEKDIEEIVVDGKTLVIKDIPGLHYWSEKVLSYVPIQSNSSARTTTDDPIYLELRRVMKPFIETHSHNTMAAFKSGTDKANSDNEGLQLVFGKLASDTKYDFKSWATISGQQFDDVSYEELLKFIELPKKLNEVKQLNGYKVSKKLIEEWVNQCKFSIGYVPAYGLYGNTYINFSRKKVKPEIGSLEDDLEYEDFYEDLYLGLERGYGRSKAKKKYNPYDNMTLKDRAFRQNQLKLEAKNERMAEDKFEQKKINSERQINLERSKYDLSTLKSNSDNKKEDISNLPGVTGKIGSDRVGSEDRQQSTKIPGFTLRRL